MSLQVFVISGSKIKLPSGINPPVCMAIIKGTQVFNPENGQWVVILS